MTASDIRAIMIKNTKSAFVFIHAKGEYCPYEKTIASDHGFIFDSVLFCSCRFLNETAVCTATPEDVAASLSSHATATKFAVNTWQIVLPDVHASEAAFLKAGYISVGASVIEEAHNPPKVFRGDHNLVTLQQTEAGTKIVWDICDPSVASLLSPNKNTGKDSSAMVQLGVERVGNVTVQNAVRLRRS